MQPHQPDAPRASASPDPAADSGRAAPPFPMGAPTAPDRPMPSAGTSVGVAAPGFASHAPTVPDQAPPPVKMLGGFEIQSLLAQGGMGQVFLARDPHLNRVVAIKTLRPDMAGLSIMGERFLQEARAAAALAHPNIVQVYAAGVEDGVHYFAMEFVQGRSLKEIVDEDGPLAPEVALDYAAQAARGLKAAAAKKIVHRDIKPSNLILDPEGLVKIADFGLAKDLESSSELTSAGSAVGSPYYMSPEQCAGEQVFIQADMYSLGATLWYLLAGSPPFQADKRMAVMMKHINDPLPHHPGIEAMMGGRLAPFLRRLLAKKPEQRHQSYDELIADIENIFHQGQGGSLHRYSTGALPPGMGQGARLPQIPTGSMPMGVPSAADAMGMRNGGLPRTGTGSMPGSSDGPYGMAGHPGHPFLPNQGTSSLEYPQPPSRRWAPWAAAGTIILAVAISAAIWGWKIHQSNERMRAEMLAMAAAGNASPAPVPPAPASALPSGDGSEGEGGKVEKVEGTRTIQAAAGGSGRASLFAAGPNVPPAFAEKPQSTSLAEALPGFVKDDAGALANIEGCLLSYGFREASTALGETAKGRHDEEAEKVRSIARGLGKADEYFRKRVQNLKAKGAHPTRIKFRGQLYEATGGSSRGINFAPLPAGTAPTFSIHYAQMNPEALLELFDALVEYPAPDDRAHLTIFSALYQAPAKSRFELSGGVFDDDLEALLDAVGGGEPDSRRSGRSRFR